MVMVGPIFAIEFIIRMTFFSLPGIIFAEYNNKSSFRKVSNGEAPHAARAN